VCNTMGVEATAPTPFFFLHDYGYPNLRAQRKAQRLVLRCPLLDSAYRTNHQIHRELDLSTSYDELQLEQLRDLEQFLKMSWDVWMDDMGAVLLPAEVAK
jgi:hypothetical protein